MPFKLGEKYPDIKILGINKSQDAQDTITVLEKNGIKIAVLNYTYGLNGIALPSDMPYAVNLLDEEKVKSRYCISERNSPILLLCVRIGEQNIVCSRTACRKSGQKFLQKAVLIWCSERIRM